MRALPITGILLCLVALIGCAPTRIERYYTLEAAPTVKLAETSAQLLYFKQSQRHFYATVRFVNHGMAPLVAVRSGAEAVQITLETAQLKQAADGPTRSSWTPWSGTVEQTEAKAARVELAPGEARDVTLRWEFPTTVGSYSYAWTMTFHGLRRGDGLEPDIVINSPPVE
jgi:hypothetical protein